MKAAAIALGLALCIPALAAVAAPAAKEAAPTTLLMSPDEETRMALLAGPEHLRAGAALYLYTPDGYHLARAGTNGFACMVNRDGNQAGDNLLKPTCWDAEGARAILPIMLRVGELIARSASSGEIAREVDAGFASGRFASPGKAGIAYMLDGDWVFDPAAGKVLHRQNPPHYMIYAPGVSNADIGATGPHPPSAFALPGVFSGYSGGARTAYIIVHAMENDAPRGGD